jgi:hypothetical protein
MRKNIIILFLLSAACAVGYATSAKFFENFKFQGNTISATNTNGNVIVTPNGTGKFRVSTLNAANFVTVDSSGNFLNTKGIPTGDVVGTTDVQALTNKYFQDANMQGVTIVGDQVHYADDDANFVAIKAADAMSADYTLTYPSTAVASDGQSIVYTTGGVGSWNPQRIVSATLNCDSGSAITYQYPSGVFATLGNVSGGACSGTFTSGFWSVAPVCTATIQSAVATTSLSVAVQASSTTAFFVDCVSDAGTSAASAACTAYDINVICFGPR